MHTSNISNVVDANIVIIIVVVLRVNIRSVIELGMHIVDSNVFKVYPYSYEIFSR